MNRTAGSPMPSFVADSSLGKLAKWLRLAGLDTRLDTKTPELQRLRHYARTEGRSVLTRTQRIIRYLAENQGLLIESDAPLCQVRQVLKHFDLERGDLRVLSRCTICNRLLQPTPKESLPADIPDYVRHRHDRFLTCGRCGRVYWPGTHSVRVLALIDGWFK
jgi:uncharacterized protein with PIN domain